MIHTLWQRLSIQSQLTLLMVLLITFIEVTTLGLVNWFDIKERQVIAIEQAITLENSLNNDLLLVLLNLNADHFSDISFRIEGFKSVDALLLENNKGQAVFAFGEQGYFEDKSLVLKTINEPYFDTTGRLFIKLPVMAGDNNFGTVTIVVNPDRYNTGVKQNFITLLWIFPLALLLGFIIAWRISLYYIKPFKELADAMQQNDIGSNVFKEVKTIYRNEIGILFSGYNKMIAEVDKTTKTLQYRNTHDDLTGLLSRFAIEEKIASALQNEQSISHVLLSLDLDQFKNINDSVGHVAGDELLQIVAHRCKQNLPESAYLARVGGDDFFILLEGANESQGVDIAKKLLDELSELRFVWENEIFSVSATIGLVAFKPFEYIFIDLIKSVDAAFYVAKSKGQNKMHVHKDNPRSKNKLNTEINISRYIKEALKKGPSRFELYAQDIVPLQTKTDKVSYEILLRMWNDNNEFLAPDSFLPIAERYQLIVDIDIYVLKTYLNIICSHPEHVKNLHSVHINLAGGTLNHPDFQDFIKGAIKEFNFPWNKLELEITETSSIGNLMQAQEFIEFCKKQGIGFALDDFGTGMSSFDYLKNLPFDVVKIDGIFVRDMLTDPFSHAMIRHTHEICKLRNQETVAEYVETQADVDELRKIGITYGQGYFLGKPRPLSEWLET